MTFAEKFNENSFADQTKLFSANKLMVITYSIIQKLGNISLLDEDIQTAALCVNDAFQKATRYFVILIGHKINRILNK